MGAGAEHTKDNARAAGCLEPTALTGRLEGRGPEPCSPAGHHADEQSSELPQTITVNTDNITVGKIMLAYDASFKCFITKRSYKVKQVLFGKIVFVYLSLEVKKCP